MPTVQKFRERDMQRSKLYKAEQAALGGFDTKPDFVDLDECERYVRKIESSERMIGAGWPRGRKTNVSCGKGARSATSFGGRIDLPRTMRRRWVIIHEMAHELRNYQRRVEAQREYLAGQRRPKPAPHGWEFAATYLQMVLWFLGREAHDKLKASFKSHKVRYTAPRASKPLTPEQKAALAARLAAYRLKKAETATAIVDTMLQMAAHLPQAPKPPETGE